jgi:creatinine amidohydrolase
MTWEEVRALPPFVAILPVGATEAHGPHLPLATDVVIAEAMARDAAARLPGPVVLLPPLAYSAAGYAAGFPGTVSVRPETVTALIVDIAEAVKPRVFAIANAHLDPSHLASLHAAVAQLKMPVAFPDITRKPWATRLTDEFKSGACHAGQFEGSVVLAERTDLVREAIRKSLPPNPVSIGKAIREGKRTFEEAGGARAYFGDPAAATAEEGRRTIETLGAILADAVLDLKIL